MEKNVDYLVPCVCLIEAILYFSGGKKHSLFVGFHYFDRLEEEDLAESKSFEHQLTVVGQVS
jgi:hypothetical protein